MATKTTKKTAAKKGSAKAKKTTTKRKASQPALEKAALLVLDTAQKNTHAAFDVARAPLVEDDIRAAFKAQRGIVSKAVKDNVKVARKLNDMARDAVEDAVEPVSKRVRDAIENVRGNLRRAA